MLQRLKCVFGRHKRDRRRAKQGDDGLWHSVCEGCGKPMVKAYTGTRGVWRLAE